MTFLTYGYLRGRAYRTLEPTARPFEVTYGYAGKDFANALAEAIRSVLLTEEPNVEAPTEAEIKAWLAIPETAERTAARAAALRAAAEKRAKTAAQYRAARRCSGEGA